MTLMTVGLKTKNAETVANRATLEEYAKLVKSSTRTKYRETRNPRKENTTMYINLQKAVLIKTKVNCLVCNFTA